jgi:hypothetical protein
LWCIHNSIELEKKGLPTTVICSSKFETLIETTARAKGFPNFSHLTLPHPIAENDAALIKGKADSAIEELINILTNSVVNFSVENKEETG